MRRLRIPRISCQGLFEIADLEEAQTFVEASPITSIDFTIANSHISYSRAPLRIDFPRTGSLVVPTESCASLTHGLHHEIHAACRSLARARTESRKCSVSLLAVRKSTTLPNNLVNSICMRTMPNITGVFPGKNSRAHQHRSQA